MQKTVLIGIGTAGCRIVSKYNSQVDKLFFDTDAAVEDYSGLRFGVEIEDEFFGEGDALLSAQAFRDLSEDVEKLVRPYRKLFVVALLGGATSYGIACAFAQMILTSFQEKDLTFVVGSPFEFEGINRHDRAKKALLFLNGRSNVLLVPNLEYRKVFSSRCSIKDIFPLQDKIFFEELDKLLLRS